MRETVLAMLEQHVLLGERHIARQREIVADFHLRGFRTDLAEELLSLFEQMQLLHVAHRDRLLRLTAEGIHRRSASRYGGAHGNRSR